ncbi:MAG: OmpA family protein [Fibromonadales bacterium]|nr:OmpA family protein [Fibromonadales bacterium]
MGRLKFIVLLVALLAISAFAGEGSFNYYGQLGFHKTQSAYTIGHGRFGVGLFAEGAGLHSMIDGGQICVPVGNEQPYGLCQEKSSYAPLGSTYIGINGYPFVSLGLSEYFDFGIGIPLYGEFIGIENRPISDINDNGCLVGGHDCPDNIDAAGWGNLQFLAKLRAPWGDAPVNLSLILGAALSTGRTDYYGLWIRDPSFLNTKDSASPIVPGASGYTNGGAMFKFGGAFTFDFNYLRTEIPLMLHINYMYRMTLGEFGSSYPKVQSLATALEWTPFQYISLMGEFYKDMPSEFPKNKAGEEDYAGTSTLAFGTALHFNKHFDLQLGFQMRVGDDDKYIEKLAIPMNKLPDGTQRYGTYNATLVPKYLVFGGLTVRIFVTEQEEEEEDDRNPDIDDDGVCDPWVKRENRQREYADVCSGVDKCPHDPGELENKGCPEEEEEEEEEEEAPVIKFDVSEESISSGQSATIIWMVSNADKVSINQGVGEVGTEGKKKVKPTETTIYTITATGPGGTKKKSIEVVVEAAAGPSIDFSASSESVQKGQPVTLTWSVTEATEVSIAGIGKVKNTGSKTVKPASVGPATFTLTATGPGGTKTESVEVEVLGGPLPTILFTASSETIQDGQTVTLNWQVSNATEVSIEGLGKVPAKGNKKLKPAETTVYKLIATGDGGTEAATVEVEVAAPPPAPVIEAQVNLKGVTFGSGNATLTPNAKKVLDGVAEQLLAYPKVKIEIHGYTDNQGKPQTNLELSERRAKAVVGYLATQGVSMGRMKAVGFGQDNPIADNKTPAGREQNRRIEMIRAD